MSVLEHSNIQMRKITHSKVEVRIYNWVQGIDDVVCEGGQAEDDDSKNLEYAISRD